MSLSVIENAAKGPADAKKKELVEEETFVSLARHLDSEMQSVFSDLDTAHSYLQSARLGEKNAKRSALTDALACVDRAEVYAINMEMHAQAFKRQMDTYVATVRGKKENITRALEENRSKRTKTSPQ